MNSSERQWFLADAETPDKAMTGRTVLELAVAYTGGAPSTT